MLSSLMMSGFTSASGATFHHTTSLAQYGSSIRTRDKIGFPSRITATVLKCSDGLSTVHMNPNAGPLC